MFPILKILYLFSCFTSNITNIVFILPTLHEVFTQEEVKSPLHTLHEVFAQEEVKSPVKETAIPLFGERARQFRDRTNNKKQFRSAADLGLYI